MDNQEKRKNYAKQKESLKKAIKYEFWLQAVLIEYAILEDRTESVLRHAGTVKLTNKRGNTLKLSEKLNKVRSCEPFTNKTIRKYFPIELIDEIYEWKENRDRFVHALLKTTIDEEELKKVAVEGEKLVKIVDSRVKSINRILSKTNTEENK